MTTTTIHRRSTRTPLRTRLTAATALALLAGGLVAGCSAGDDASDAPAAGGDGGGRAYDEGDVLAEPAAESSAADADRQVIQTGSVWMTVDEPVQVADQLVAFVEDAGGRVDGREEETDRGDGSASVTLTVRVPADRVGDAIVRLRELGDVDSVDLQAQDVTGAAQDLDARITAAQASVARLEELMAQTGSVKDLLSAESTLADRQASLEQLQAQRARLADQVSLSTLQVSFDQPGVVPAAAEQPRTFVSGLEVGWQSLTAVVRGLVVVLGVVLPWVVAVGIVTALVVLTVRRTRRRPVAAADGDPAPEPTA